MSRSGAWAVLFCLLCTVICAQDRYHEGRYQLRGRGGAVTGPEGISYGWFLPDGKLVTVGGHEPPAVSQNLALQEQKIHEPHLISLWDPESGVRLAVGDHERDLEIAEISPDGRYLAAWDGHLPDSFADGAVRLFNIASRDHHFGDQVAVLGGLTRHVEDVEFSSDGGLVAVHYYDYARTEDNEEKQLAVRIFNCKTALIYCSFTLQGDLPALELCFSPDGRYLAGYGSNQTLVWDVKRRRQIAKVEEPDGGYTATFSKSGDALVHVWEDENFQAKAYPIKNGEVVTKMADDFDPAKAMEILYPSGLTHKKVGAYGLQGNEVQITDVSSGKPAVKLVRQPRPPWPPPPLGIGYGGEGIHAISDDGHYALIDSQVLDLKLEKLTMLDLMPVEEYRPWGVVPITDTKNDGNYK